MKRATFLHLLLATLCMLTACGGPQLPKNYTEINLLLHTMAHGQLAVEIAVFVPKEDNAADSNRQQDRSHSHSVTVQREG